jgi:hypothetical protein
LSEAETRALPRQRWERVAQSFLRPPPARAFRVAVAGPDDARRVSRIKAELERGLQRLASDGAIVEGMVQLEDLGAVDERRLDRLGREKLPAADLLLWTVARRGADRTRSLYLLGVFLWVLMPRRAVCVLEGGGRVSSSVHAGLDTVGAVSGVHRPLDIHHLDHDRGGGRVPTLTGILQAALAKADARLRAGGDRMSSSASGF